MNNYESRVLAALNDLIAHAENSTEVDVERDKAIDRARAVVKEIRSKSIVTFPIDAVMEGVVEGLDATPKGEDPTPWIRSCLGRYRFIDTEPIAEKKS